MSKLEGNRPDIEKLRHEIRILRDEIDKIKSEFTGRVLQSISDDFKKNLDQLTKTSTGIIADVANHYKKKISMVEKPKGFFRRLISRIF